MLEHRVGKIFSVCNFIDSETAFVAIFKCFKIILIIFSFCLKVTATSYDEFVK